MIAINVCSTEIDVGAVECVECVGIGEVDELGTMKII
jgi:hypothetical protein